MAATAVQAPAVQQQRRALSAWWALGIYALLAFAFFGVHVAAHPGTTLLAGNDIDASQGTWFLAWWPHAIGHGLDPFITKEIFYPEGFNLSWATPVPALSLLALPVTLTAGPTVAFNVVLAAAPALNALSAFVLCRYVTRKTLPSLVGGYVYGFGPYVVANVHYGEMNLASVWLIPVFVLLVLKRLDGSLPERRFVVLTALVGAFQFLIHHETLATTAIFGTFAFAVAALVYPERRAEIIRTALLSIGSMALVAVFVSPWLYVMLTKDHTVPQQAINAQPADFFGFVVPSYFMEFATGHTKEGVPSWTNGSAYLGAALLVLVAVFAWAHRTSRAARLVVGVFVVVIVCSLGERLLWRGTNPGIPMPWQAFSELPLLRYAIPVRFTLYALLCAAVIVSMWLAWRPSAWRWALAALALLMILPSLRSDAWKVEARDPAFISSGQYKRYLKGDDVVLTVPTWGPNMRWQANEDFPWPIAGGYGGAFPDSYWRYPTFRTLIDHRLQPGYAGQLRRFVRDKRVTAIIVDTRIQGPWRQLFGSLGVRPVQTGGVLFYRVPSR